MESLTYMKNIKVSPKKMRMMLDVVKKKKPQEALDFLLYSPKKEAKVYYKAVHSAISNAVNALKVEAGVLQFKLLTIEEGRSLNRYRPGSRGTAKPIKRRYSHIKIILEGVKEKPKKLLAPKTEKKVEKAASVKKTATVASQEKKEVKIKEIKKDK